MVQVGMIFPYRLVRPQCCVPDKATYAGHRLEELLPVLDQSGVQYSQTEDSVTVLVFPSILKMQLKE